MTALETTLAIALLVVVALAWSFRLRLRAAEARHAHVIVEERARHQAGLEEQASRYTSLFDRMLDGVILVGTDGHIRFANRAAGELFEQGKPMVGRTVLEATRRHEVTEIVRAVGSEADVFERELRLEQSGKVRTLQIIGLALFGPGNQRDGAMLISHDVTRLRQLESVRQDFVANVSHELRTPLSLIKSAAETLLDGGKADPGVTDRFLDIIDKNASRLTLLIDDLLLLARLDSGRLELSFQPVALRGAVQEALDDAGLLAHARAIALRNEIDDGMVALADPERLRQVLTNLIDNAIKYGRTPGTVVVTGRRLDAHYVEVSVSDDGPGIPEEAKVRIFERFYRVDKARAREQGGTGLGLAIVKNVVEAHGGDIRVESSAGRGTTFHFTLRRPQSPHA